MPKREILQTIILGRGTKTIKSPDGKTEQTIPEKRLELKPGTVFDFTEEELADVMTANPNAVSSKTTIDLDAEDSLAALRTEQTLNSNQTSAPGATGSADKVGSSGAEL